MINSDISGKIKQIIIMNAILKMHEKHFNVVAVRC